MPMRDVAVAAAPAGRKHRGVDLDLYNLLLAFGRARERAELVRMGILKASRQADQGFHLEFARRLRDALGDGLTVIDAADHRLLRGPAFYDLFIDRSRWPALIREGHARATRALTALRRHHRGVAA